MGRFDCHICRSAGARVELADGDEDLPASSLTRLMTALSRTHCMFREQSSLMEEGILVKLKLDGGHIPQRMESRDLNRCSYTHVHGSITPNSQNVQTTQMCFHR